MTAPCARCDGCGMIANSDDGEPWTAWMSLPPGSDLAVRLGLVRPIRCPDCKGRSLQPPVPPPVPGMAATIDDIDGGSR